MKLVKIIKNNITTHQAIFDNETQAQAWLDREGANGSFGKPERWISEYLLQTMGESIENSSGSRVVQVPGGEVTEYYFAAEFTHQITDITSQLVVDKKIKERKLKREFGEYIIDKIAFVNESKIGDVDDVDAFMSNPVIIKMREHLKAGNIDTFLAVLFKTDVSAFFTNQEKEMITQECRAFLQTLD